MLAVNGQVPGPTIEANWGDTVQVTVNNQLDCNGTSMHWHGMRQLYSNDMDGVNGVTECPLAPGQSKTYTFQATEYGTSWYHSHFSAQYGDGVQGPIIIHGPSSANYDEDLGTITVAEYYDDCVYQEDYFAERTGPPTADGYLLNGQNMNPYGTAGTRPTWTFEAGKKYLLRFINTSVDNMFKLQLDDHVMTVVSTDFVQIQPYNTTTLSIGIGQRYDVIIEANQPVDSYYLRAINQVSCGTNNNTGLGTSNGVIYYEGSDTTALPTSTYYPYTDACVDEPLASLVPVVTIPVDPTGFADAVGTLPVNLTQITVAGELLFRWTLNSESLNIVWQTPTLQQSAAGNHSFPTVADVITLPNEGVWTFWCIQNQFFVPHPMHLHGHDFAVLGQGTGTFDSSMIGQLNFENPARRDVAMLIANGWTVLAFKTDNPGAWLMHCHIAWHVGEGLALQFLEVPDKIPGLYQDKVTSQAYLDTCSEWNSYYEGPPAPAYEKDDSGLRRREEVPVVAEVIDAHRWDGVGQMHSNAKRMRRGFGGGEVFVDS